MTQSIIPHYTVMLINLTSENFKAIEQFSNDCRKTKIKAITLTKEQAA